MCIGGCLTLKLDRRAGKSVEPGSRYGLRICFLSASLLSLVAQALLLSSCSPDAADILMPAGDVRPPVVLEAGQSAPGAFFVRFDEGIRLVQGSFGFSPKTSSILPSAAGDQLTVGIDPALKAGMPCLLSGEVDDDAGNSTRFIFDFVAYNANPAVLRLEEVQTGKNNSATNNHRDYLEFQVLSGGELGGLSVQWASSVKTMEYCFPPCSAARGEYIVLHCSPEGLASEKNETGGDLAASGGVDSSPQGRDFWTTAGGLPDETGIVVLRDRAEAPPRDGLFYASEEKTGKLDSEKILSELEDLSAAGLWSCSSLVLWEDAFLWKSSSARPLYRDVDAPKGWKVGEAGSQSPGVSMPVGGAVKSRKKRQ